MNAEVVSTGTELLLGEIVDTNSAYIARQLRDIGVNLYCITMVGDNRERIADAIRASLARADVVITTGGLGPTVDDMTRQAVADATDRDLEFHPELLEQIAERFRQLNAPMSENNRIQAYIPARAIPVTNRLGTAPCYIVEAENGTVISLPGVPREMMDILHTTVLPYLRERAGGSGIIKAKVLRTAGIGESQIDARIADLMVGGNPTVGLAAHSGQTDIRITARADSEDEADRMIADTETVVRERVGEFIYGTGTEPLEEAFVALLGARGWRLALSYNGADGETFRERLHRAQGGAVDVIATELYEDDLAALLERLELAGQDAEPKTLDYCELSRAEAKRLLEAGGADVAIAVVTHEAGTGITALTALDHKTRCYRFGGAGTDAPFWAGTWGISMAWRLVRQAAGD